MDEFLSLLETVLRVFEISQSPQTFLVLVGLTFARLVSFFSIVPFFGGASVPSRVKVATAMSLVIILYPRFRVERRRRLDGRRLEDARRKRARRRYHERRADFSRRFEREKFVGRRRK